MKKLFATVLIFFLCQSGAYSHTINYQLEKLGNDEVFLKFLNLGFTHILPYGIDHVLFILCVFFIDNNIKKIILQATMFTLAHSVTLALSVYGIITPISSIVEPLIAVSILLLALENIFVASMKPWRIMLVFIFGLVHGLGFAGALNELGMPSYAFANALLSFNIGVEAGQLCIIMLMYLLFYKISKNSILYRKWIVVPGNAAIALMAIFWTFERIFNI